MKDAFITMALALVMVVGSFSNVFACTGTYVGKKVSENGSTLVARTEDIGSAHPKSVVVYPARDHASGTMYESEITNFKYPNPVHTYKYFAVPDSDGNNDDGIYDEVGFNEHGLSISATVSADIREEINFIDPLVEDGLREADTATLVLSRCKTAREGVELIAKIVDEKGSAEGNITMIADKDEVWYMEIVSGHQYAAIKLPDDVVAVIPNCLMLDYVDVNDKENVIASKNLISMPKENGLIKNRNGKFSVRRTYAPEMIDYDRARIWGGQHFLAPSKNLPYEADFELFFKPDKKVSVKDVMELQKYRYEDTTRNTNLPENQTEENTVRPIGIERQAECHIFELKDTFPKNAPGILWLSLGNAEHNVYLPYFPNIDKVPEQYSNRSHYFDENQAFWVFRAQATLAELNREKYGTNVRKYWTNYQDELLKEQEIKNQEFLKLYNQDSKMAVNFANDEINRIGMQAYDKAKKMYSELFKYVANEAGRPSEEKFMPSEMTISQK